MKRLLGILALISLLLSTGIVVYLLTNPLMALIFTPYLVLTSALTLSFSTGYFYALNNVKSGLFSIMVYSIAFVPTIIPILACFDPDFMETLWRNYISLTMLQLGTGILAATFFFKNPGINFANVCAAVSSMILFVLGIFVLLETSLLGSVTFLVLAATLVSILFFIALFSRLRQMN
jgi:hypothetical protein